MSNIKIFVARRWPDDENPINGYIINLIKRAGMQVSKEMKKKGTNIELKIASSIIEADAFCAIVTPKDNEQIPRFIQYEISTAKRHNIPSFVFVDRTMMGRGEIITEIHNLVAKQEMTGEWMEFWEKDLFSGKQDEEILTWLQDIYFYLEENAERLREQRNLMIAATVAGEKSLSIQPFNIGLNLIADSYDKDPSKIYDIISQAAVLITGGQMGFVGLPIQEGLNTTIKISGFFSQKSNLDHQVFENLKLEYGANKTCKGLTAYVALTGDSVLENNLQNGLVNEYKYPVEFVDTNIVGINSEICVPIKIKNRVVGLIDVEHISQNKFKWIHIVVLEWLAKIAAITFSNHQLDKYIKLIGLKDIDRLSIYEELNSTNNETNFDSNDKRQVFGNGALRVFLNFSQADYGFIALKEKETGKFKVLATNLKDVINPIDFLDKNKGLTGMVLNTGKSLYIEDVSVSNEYHPFWEHTTSEIVLPAIDDKGEIQGIVNLEYRQVQDFSSIDKKLFNAMAKLIALGVPE